MGNTNEKAKSKAQPKIDTRGNPAAKERKQAQEPGKGASNLVGTLRDYRAARSGRAALTPAKPGRK